MNRLSELILEMVILLVFGIFILLFGFISFRILAGELPYSPDGIYWILLIIPSFQIITMGKVPFGSSVIADCLYSLASARPLLGHHPVLSPASFQHW